jgi:hypothetical protein
MKAVGLVLLLVVAGVSSFEVDFINMI